MGLMMLAAGPGAVIDLEAEGPEAPEAIEALVALVEWLRRGELAGRSRQPAVLLCNSPVTASRAA